MKDAVLTKAMFVVSLIGAFLLRLDISETVNFIAQYISIVSFLVILVSNWGRFAAQIRKWRYDKARKKKA